MLLHGTLLLVYIVTQYLYFTSVRDCIYMPARLHSYIFIYYIGTYTVSEAVACYYIATYGYMVRSMIVNAFFYSYGKCTSLLYCYTKCRYCYILLHLITWQA